MANLSSILGNQFKGDTGPQGPQGPQGAQGDPGPTVYPSQGIPTSTGTAWGASMIAPVGAIVGTTDAQTLTNKTIAYSNNTLTGVQPTLVSGTNIKTINDTSLLGSGNISIATDISITHNNNSVIVNSSDGTDGTINAATTTDAGVMSALDKTKLDGIATGAEVNVNADWNAVSGDAQILNKPTLGTAAAANTTDFATAAQGEKADTALQPAAIGVSLQAYDADLTSIAGLTGTSGLLKKTAANTWSLDTNVYLTSYTETDPVFSASAASGITTTNISNWNTAYGWGNHASAGYLTSAAIGTTVQGYNANTVIDAAYVHTDNNYTTAEKTKLSGIAAGAEVNVNADWNAISGDAQILNKPLLATVATSGSYNDLADKPTIPAAYTDASVDAHLNKGTAATGEVLSWNGTDYDWVPQSAGGGGTVTSVALTAPIGLSVSGSPVTTSGTIALSYQAGYSIPTDAKQTNWDTAYGWGNHASAGYLTSAAIGTTVQAYDADLTSWAGIAPSAKQDTLVSGTNIKTINSQSLLGSGDIVISGGGGSSALTIDNKTAAYTVVASDLGKIINCTSGGFIVSLTAAATLGAGFNCWIWNTSNSVVTIDPSGTETIDGISTIDLRQGEGTQIVCTGSNWLTGDKKTMRGYAENFPTGTGRPTASGVYAVAIGRAAQATNNGSVAIGPFANSSSTSSVAIGQDALASSNYAVAIGLNSSGNASQAVTGAGAMAFGGSYASGTDSFAAAIANNTSTYGARGANSVALGNTATATSTNSFAVGNNAQASNTNGVAIGQNASASGNSAIALGVGTSASGAASIALGHSASASQNGKFSFSYDKFALAGDGQTGLMVLRRATTDATATVLTSGASTPSAANQVILPNNSAYAFTGIIIARQSAAQGTASAAWRVEGLIRREANAASTVLVNSALTVIDNTPGWTLALSADTTNGGLAVAVTGAAATNIRWVATVTTSEVTYA